MKEKRKKAYDSPLTASVILTIEQSILNPSNTLQDALNNTIIGEDLDD